MSLFLSRLTLRRDPSTSALKQLINPGSDGDRTDAHHRLLWSVFSDSSERKRDFLWRAEPNGKFFTLSQRPPLSTGLFEPPQYKEFSPKISEGDALAFVLRANAVRSLSKKWSDPSGKKQLRGKKVDVAMHLLHEVPGSAAIDEGESSKRAPARYNLAEKASRQWLVSQGERHGFSININHFQLNDYSTVSLPRNKRTSKNAPSFGIFDMAGILTVTEPEIFVKQLALGFGRAKSFGQGLMLIKRV